MRQKIVLFVLGVLIGSLFVVSAYPTKENSQISSAKVLSVRVLKENGYTAYLIYDKNGLPLNLKLVETKVRKIVERQGNVKWHAYALPDLPSGIYLLGYGIKVLSGGKVNVLVYLSSKDSLQGLKNVESELIAWGKKKPDLLPDIISNDKVGVPDGWEVKTVDSSGVMRVYNGENTPHWHNFGKIEIYFDYKPYGRLYGKFYVWGLWNDNDPNKEWFTITPYGGGPNGVDGVYRVVPGVALKDMVDGYGLYFTDDIKIIHDWGVDPKLKGKLGPIQPAGIIGSHDTRTITLGPSPGISYTVDVNGYKVYGDAISPKAVWKFDIPYNEDASHHTIEFNGYSEGSVDEGALHDGEWHAVFRVEMWVRFRSTRFWGQFYHHDGSVSVSWFLKVG